MLITYRGKVSVSIFISRNSFQLLLARVNKIFGYSADFSLSLVTVRKRTCGKVMFYTPVFVSVHKGELTPNWVDTPPGRGLQRAVRIPLECILAFVCSFYPCCSEPYPALFFSLVIQRNPAFYNFVMVYPSVLLSALTPVLFLTPPSVQDRNGFGKDVSSILIQT